MELPSARGDLQVWRIDVSFDKCNQDSLALHFRGHLHCWLKVCSDVQCQTVKPLLVSIHDTTESLYSQEQLGNA